MSKLTTRNATPGILAIELANDTVWQGNKISGHPMRGIGDMQRGILPEPYWTAAEDAVYAVYHHETPIVWRTESGAWVIPDHNYGQTTSAFRNKIVKALEINGAEIIWI